MHAKQSGVAVKLHIYIREVTGLNLDRDTSYLTEIFRGYTQYL
jgi:hypothetical protein